MLLNLPTELIQLILRSCDTPAYLHAAWSCRTLFEIASGTREVILHHLDRTPGLPDGDIEVAQTRVLFRWLVKRAFQQLYGAEFHADRKIFHVQGRQIDPRASTVEAVDDRIRALVVFKNHSAVHLFHVEKGSLAHELRLKSPGAQFGTVQVLRTALDGDRGIYLLHRFKPSVDQDDVDPNHPFVKHARQSNSSGRVFLAYHDLQSPAGRIRLRAFPDHDGYEPLALAVARDKFAISWQHMQEADDHEVVLYTLDEEETDDDDDSDPSNVTYVTYDSYVLRGPDEQGGPSDNGLANRGPAVRLDFNDRGTQLLHHYRAHTLYGAFQRIAGISFADQSKPPKLHANSCVVPFTSSLALQFAIGIPFFGSHGPGDDGVTCHWQYLAFGVATHRVEQWTVACLLKSEAFCQARNCGHVLNLERGRRFDEWDVVARLEGFKDWDISHGSRVAASRLGTRIAVASWKTVYIWALEPHALVEDNEDDFYPFSSYSPSTWLIELQPVVLQLDAVCYQLTFTGQEDELVTVTDRGILSLDLGPAGRGKCTTHTIREDIVGDQQQ